MICFIYYMCRELKIVKHEIKRQNGLWVYSASSNQDCLFHFSISSYVLLTITCDINNKLLRHVLHVSCIKSNKIPVETLKWSMIQYVIYYTCHLLNAVKYEMKHKNEIWDFFLFVQSRSPVSFKCFILYFSIFNTLYVNNMTKILSYKIIYYTYHLLNILEHEMRHRSGIWNLFRTSSRHLSFSFKKI